MINCIIDSENTGITTANASALIRDHEIGFQEPGIAGNMDGFADDNIAHLFSDSPSSNDVELRIPVEKNEWGKADERLYDDLVTKEALGDINEIELAHLNVLQVIRRNYHHPRKWEEIAGEYYTNQALKEIISGLQKYVYFRTSYSQK